MTNKLLMSPDQVVGYLIEGGKLTIENGEDGDFVPIVVTQDKDGTVLPILLGVQREDLHTALASVLAHAALTPLHMVSFSTDSFLAHWDKERFAAEAAKGPISLRDHFNNKDPQVTECLMVYFVMEDNGLLVSRGWSQPYRRTDDGIIWGDTMDKHEHDEGRIPKALEMALVLSTMAPA